MYTVDFKQPRHVHFIGIGGISMSGLAEILLKEGFTVSGSDSKESPLTNQLKEAGATIFIGQKATNIVDGIDVVVYTAAIRENNEEFMEAKRQNLPMLTRAQLLGQLMTNYEIPIAVSGTHGKTTTTSMVSHIFLAANADPTISVGGILKAIHGNIRVGSSELFVTEACEYTNSFLEFLPKISIILNVDADHLDFFKDLDDIRHSFRRFAEILPEDGTLVINSDIPDMEYFTEGLKCKVITVGKAADADYTVADVCYDDHGNGSFHVVRRGVKGECYSLSVGGEHNVYNALAAIAVADTVGIDAASTQKGLQDFHGTDRRFEYKGTKNGFTIIDDYAHHPTEIEATLRTAVNYPHKELWCIFQSHTYSRTKSLFNEFAEALTHADHMIIADIYAARETDTLGVSGEQLAAAINEKGGNAIYLPDFETIQNYVLEHVKSGDVLITMGAGDVVNIGENLLRD